MSAVSATPQFAGSPPPWRRSWFRVLGAVVGAAAGLTLTTTTLGASRVTPSRCASTGLTVTPTLTGATWTAVVVGGIPATCGGATLQLTVDTAVTNSSGSAVVPAGRRLRHGHPGRRPGGRRRDAGRPRVRRAMKRRAAAAAAIGLLIGLSSSTGSAASLSVTSQALTPMRTCILTATPATTVVVADTTVRQGSPTTAGGTLTSLTVSSAAAANQRAYARFDLAQCHPAIPASATVRVATLRLFSTVSRRVPRTIDVFRVTATWAEATVTWNTQPFGTTIKNPASGSRTDSFNVGTPAGCENLTATTRSISGADVTTDVAAFVAGSATNFGWMLRDDTEGSATVRTWTTASKDLGTLARAPQIVVELGRGPVSRRLRRWLGWLLLVAAAATWVLVLRPTSLGGPATYIVIRGDSMDPTYATGDLVILERAASYGLGDIVAYRVPAGELGAGLAVVHRIVSGTAEAGFTLRGDNNPGP